MYKNTPSNMLDEYQLKDAIQWYNDNAHNIDGYVKTLLDFDFKDERVANYSYRHILSIIAHVFYNSSFHHPDVFTGGIFDRGYCIGANISIMLIGSKICKLSVSAKPSISSRRGNICPSTEYMNIKIEKFVNAPIKQKSDNTFNPFGLSQVF